MITNSQNYLSKTPVGEIPKEGEGNFLEDHIYEYPEFLWESHGSYQDNSPDLPLNRSSLSRAWFNRYNFCTGQLLTWNRIPTTPFHQHLLIFGKNVTWPLSDPLKLFNQRISPQISVISHLPLTQESSLHYGRMSIDLGDAVSPDSISARKSGYIQGSTQSIMEHQTRRRVGIIMSNGQHASFEFFPKTQLKLTRNIEIKALGR
jgi:hypothetical protein